MFIRSDIQLIANRHRGGPDFLSQVELVDDHEFTTFLYDGDFAVLGGQINQTINKQRGG